MMKLVYRLWRDEDGQDLIEYSLLITFLALATVALMGNGTAAIHGIISTSTSQIVYANASVS
jgi:Flp pilus assembly pilin Flp